MMTVIFGDALHIVYVIYYVVHKLRKTKRLT